MTKRLIMNNNDNKLNNNYNYIHKPKHYSLFSLEELRSIVAKGESIDVVAIANKAGLDKDAYMFNDADIWLKMISKRAMNKKYSMHKSKIF